MDDSFNSSTKNTDVVLGADLSILSVEDIEERILLLKQEIKRLETERDKKSASLDAANAFFKT